MVIFHSKLLVYQRVHGFTMGFLPGLVNIPKNYGKIHHV